MSRYRTCPLKLSLSTVANHTLGLFLHWYSPSFPCSLSLVKFHTCSECPLCILTFSTLYLSLKTMFRNIKTRQGLSQCHHATHFRALALTTLLYLSKIITQRPDSQHIGTVGLLFLGWLLIQCLSATSQAPWHSLCCLLFSSRLMPPPSF